MLCELLRFSDMSLTETIVVVIRHKYIVVDMIMFVEMCMILVSEIMIVERL